MGLPSITFLTPFPLELTSSYASSFFSFPSGGMISLELAAHSPQRLASLTLAVTSSGHGVYKNLPPVSLLSSFRAIVNRQSERALNTDSTSSSEPQSKGLVTLTRLFGIRSPKDRITLAIE